MHERQSGRLLLPRCDSDLRRDGLRVAGKSFACVSLLRQRTRWSVESDLDGDTADKGVDAVLLVERLDPALVDRHQRAQITTVVVDWLLDPPSCGEPKQCIRDHQQMAGFEMHDSKYPELPRLLFEWSPGFGQSPEAAQVSDDLELPTVVADAFGEYVLRIASEGDDSEEVRLALAAVEHMAASDERDIRYCAIEGLLSRLNGTEASRALIPMLGPRSQELYRRHGTNWR